ncbi:MAG: 2-oxoacid:ferredoxin oxidoreductase subunit beta, partial [Acidobacteria bacterium]|nr:2-oxoacid:ferredoxin oxidoreductase subunit beta [Acidobacteriota bacterium]
LVDFVPISSEIRATYEAGNVQDLLMHDGSTIYLHKLAKDWDPNDRLSAITALHNARKRQEVLTGLLYIDEDSTDLHSTLNTSERPLNQLEQAALCPGSEALAALNKALH